MMYEKDVIIMSRNKRKKKNPQSFFLRSSTQKANNFIETEKSFNPLRTISKMVDFSFSAFYVGFITSVWIYPENYNAEIIFNLTIILIFEFIMIHSGAFMSIFKNIFLLLAITLFYGVFVLFFNKLIIGDSPIILYLYGTTVLNRILFGISSQSMQERLDNALNSGLMAINFMFSIVITLLISFIIPYGGLTPDYLKSINYLDKITIGGGFPEQPHIAFAFGVLYFSIPIIMSIFFTIRKILKEK